MVEAYKTRAPKTREAGSRESAREKLDSLTKESRAHREAQVPHAPRTEMETAAKLSPGGRKAKPKDRGPEY